MKMKLLCAVLVMLGACGGTASIGSTDDVDGPDGGRLDDGGLPTVCAPQAVTACTCAGGAAGTQSCRPDGHALRACDCTTYGQEIFVSPTGDDGASGGADAPKATLDGALAVVRQQAANGGLPAGGVVVWMAGGVYPLRDTVTLDGELGSSSDTPVVIRAQAGEPVRLNGSTRLDPGGFTAVTASDPNYDRLDDTARASIQVFDLAAAGITDYGSLEVRGFCHSGTHSALELFIDGVAMRLGRWPDVDDNEWVRPSTSGEAIDLYGSVSPDVTGHYVKSGVTDNASIFTRQGLVDGRQYRLYRYSDTDGQGRPYQAWYLTTYASGYPDQSDPWWFLYAAGFDGPMDPTNGASGQILFADPVATNHGFVYTASAVGDHAFTYYQDRPSRWTSAPDAWMHGFWTYGWADCNLPIGTLDAGQQQITMGFSPAFGVTGGTPWYAFNLLEEVTQPGEWYLDRSLGRLYLYPPHDLAAADIEVSTLDAPLLRLDSVEHVELRGLVLEAGRANLLEIDDGAHNRVIGVTLRNSGTDGANVSGVDNGVIDALVSQTADSGVNLRGGDRPTLTRADNFVENSSFHDYARWDWAYHPAVDMTGVGQRASHNLIYNAPHNALLYSGNEHLIELNEIHDVLRFSSDAGAIYGGRDWGGRGVVIRNNYLHDLNTFFAGTGISGIYLDDCLSGIRVEGNLLVDVGGTALVHGGGRDDDLLGNVIVRASTALSTDARCSSWGRPSTVPGDSGNLLERLLEVGYQSEIWTAAYPACAAIPNTYDEIFADGAGWLFPEGTHYSSNLIFGVELPGLIRESDDALDHYTPVDNNVLADSPFVDEASGDLSFTAAALATPGFSPIPLGEIGIQ
jgi:hypothetical protein